MTLYITGERNGASQSRSERERGADVAVGRRAGKGMTSNQVNGGKKMRRDSVGPNLT